MLEFPYRAQLHCGGTPRPQFARSGLGPFLIANLSRGNDAGRKHLVHVGYGPVRFLSGPDFSANLQTVVHVKGTLGKKTHDARASLSRVLLE
jgi:hypothetical protein